MSEFGQAILVNQSYLEQLIQIITQEDVANTYTNETLTL